MISTSYLIVQIIWRTYYLLVVIYFLPPLLNTFKFFNLITITSFSNWNTNWSVRKNNFFLENPSKPLETDASLQIFYITFSWLLNFYQHRVDHPLIKILCFFSINEIMHIPRVKTRGPANFGIFFAFQIQEEALKSKIRAKKVSEKCAKLHQSSKIFDFIIFYSKNPRFDNKKHFFEKDEHKRQTLPQFWKRITELKFSAWIFALSSNW